MNLVCEPCVCYRSKQNRQTFEDVEDIECTSVPRWHVWVEGDTERMSEDSNKFGPVSAQPPPPPTTMTTIFFITIVHCIHFICLLVHVGFGVLGGRRGHSHCMAS